MFLTRSEYILVVIHCIASLELKHFGKKKHVEKRSIRRLSVNPVTRNLEQDYNSNESTKENTNCLIRSTNLNPFFRVVLRPIIANVQVKKNVWYKRPLYFLVVQCMISNWSVGYNKL